MTRDFNNQRRGDMRPSSRPQSSNRYGDERSSRPARPRLNRETVDRAWESGAPNQHADYRPRSNNYRGQASRDNQRGNQHSNQHGNWRDNQRQGQQGQYQPRNNRPPYGNQQGNYRRFDNAGNREHGEHSEHRSESRPYNPNRRSFDDRPHSDYQPRGNGARSNYQPRGEGSRPNYRGNDRPYESRSGYRDYHSNSQERSGYQRRNNDRYERGPRDFERSDRDNRDNRYDANRRPPRTFDRDNRNSRPGRTDSRNFRDKQAPRSSRDTSHPRWQSRPFAQRDRDNAYPREQFEHYPSQQEQFEGDYERFNTGSDVERYERPAREERPMRPRRPFNNTRAPREREQEPEERHVTQMPDGRVLKGSRPKQRKAAAYWTGIAHNTDELLDGIEAAPATQAEQPADEAIAVEGEEISPPGDMETATPEGEETASVEAGEAKPRRRAASAVARNRKVGAKKGKTQATGGNVPRPSKRGFKWPTP